MSTEKSRAGASHRIQCNCGTPSLSTLKRKEEGPYVSNGPDAVPTCLSAFIDCHSRYVVAGRYYFRQNLDVLIDTLLRALATHGMPLGLYVDNAMVYHSNGLKAACYRLNIQLLHRKKGDPAGGGVIERFFRTTQARFESEVRAGEILTLDSLNQAFAA
ncbi:MAG: DDE-type integrase/transposase/recombinase [Pseudomonadota bacterium]